MIYFEMKILKDLPAEDEEKEEKVSLQKLN